MILDYGAIPSRHSPPKRLMKTNRPRRKLYGIFAQSRAGDIYGFVELSFSMAFSPTHVRVWDLKEATAQFQYLQNGGIIEMCADACNPIYRAKLKSTQEENPNDVIKFFLVRINKKNSPISIRMVRRGLVRKYSLRNLPFTTKGTEQS
jgi:hypothetical protein